jgi:predicted ribosome quality control (RQC) complex YloA/Tae2 family protein
MDNLFLSALVEETKPVIIGRNVSKLALTGYELFIDLRLPRERVLKISVDPTAPSLYLSDRGTASAGDSKSVSYFLALLRKVFSGSRLIDVRKDPLDRRVAIDFEGFSAAGERSRHSMVVSLTGRTSNIYITDDGGRVETMWLERGGVEVGDRLETDYEAFDPHSLLEGIRDLPGDREVIENYFRSNPIFGPMVLKEFTARYSATDASEAFRSLIDDLFIKGPVPLLYSRIPRERVGTRPLQVKDDLLLSHFELRQASGFERYEFRTLSEAAEAYYRTRAIALRFQRDYAAVVQLLKGEIKKRDNLLKALATDRARHEDPDRLKRFGDLLLANLATAKPNGGKVSVIDYYDPDLQTVEIDIEKGQSLQQAASVFFARYQKARRALSAIEMREAELRATLSPLKEMLVELEQDPALGRIEEIRSRLDKGFKRKPDGNARRAAEKQKGAKSGRAAGRWFLSTDGFEVVVGKNDRDNDQVTFRIARPRDIWLHAADYPGSHVLIRNPDRIEVPYRAIVEAAEIAALYSGAKETGKAAVHYTQKKYVTKPPRSRPGLVRLSSFKTVMVEPRCRLERIT